MGHWVIEFGHVLIPAFLGFAGVYLLLPKVQRRRTSRAFVGGLLCLAAMGFLGGWAVTRLEVNFPEKLLFYMFAGLAILGGGLLITQRNPVHAAISFVLVVLATCGLFLLLGAPFLMGATIIVYAGAIVVTFLFVIMLAQQSGSAEADQRSREPLLASLAGFVLIGALLCILQRNYGTRELNELLIEVAKVAVARDVDDVYAVMGRPEKRLDGAFGHPLVRKLEPLLPNVDAVPNLEEAWNGLPAQLPAVKALAQAIFDAGVDRRAMLGSLPPAKSLPLSTFNGISPGMRPEDVHNGKLKEGLPARNVASLGTALFTDHLVAIQIAGMLLLVATIGAIAIAGRTKEGLR